MSSEAILRAYRDGDEEKIVKLLQQVFRDWPGFDLSCTPLEHYKWKMLDRPIRDNPIIIAEKEGEIIGITQGIYIEKKIGDKVFITQKGTEAAVNPIFRGMGIYNKIADMKDQVNIEKNIAMRIGLSNNPTINNSHTRRGNTSFPFTIKNIFRIKNIDKNLNSTGKKRTALNKLVTKYGYLTIRLFNKITNITKIYDKPKKPQITIKKIQKFDEKINVFWNEIKNSYKFISVKNDKYLNWRYCDPRGGGYEVYVSEENDKILGYTILRVNHLRKEYPEGYIMEIQSLPGRLDIADALLKHVIKCFDEQDVNDVYSLIIEGHPYERLLHQYNFIENNNVLNVSIKAQNLEGELEKFTSASPSEIDFQYGDTDSI